MRDEYYAMFRRNFPFTVREEATARRILSNPADTVLEKREDGKLEGVLVLHKNNVVMLAVNEESRGKGIGSALLSEAEKLVKAAGYDEITVGVGEDYLTPGVPTGKMVFKENLRSVKIYPGLDDNAARFFEKRGYYHAEEEANIFDMRLDWEDYVAPPIQIGESLNGVHYRFAGSGDLEAITACTDDAEPPFTKYYQNEYLYTSEDQHVLLAEAEGKVVGVLMVEEGSEEEGLGSVGCTAVREAFRGRHIATTMVMLGTGYLKEHDMKSAYLGYTYSGLDKLYGASGYSVCIYYYMAHKKL